MKLYISGAITNTRDPQKLFQQAEDILSEHGYTPINPCKNGLPFNAKWEHHMQVDLEMMANADGVAFLDGWENSMGARIERLHAEHLKLPVKSLEEWITSLERAQTHSL